MYSRENDLPSCPTVHGKQLDHNERKIEEGIDIHVEPVWYGAHHTNHDWLIVKQVVGDKAVLIADDVEDGWDDDAYGDDIAHDRIYLIKQIMIDLWAVIKFVFINTIVRIPDTEAEHPLIYYTNRVATVNNPSFGLKRSNQLSILLSVVFLSLECLFEKMHGALQNVAGGALSFLNCLHFIQYSNNYITYT